MNKTKFQIYKEPYNKNSPLIEVRDDRVSTVGVSFPWEKFKKGEPFIITIPDNPPCLIWANYQGEVLNVAVNENFLDMLQVPEDEQEELEGDEYFIAGNADEMFYNTSLIQIFKVSLNIKQMVRFAEARGQNFETLSEL